MPSSYTSNIAIEKPADGEQVGSWGDTVNENMDIVDRLTSQVGSIALTGTTKTLTTSTSGALSEGHYSLIKFTGTPGGTCTVTIDPNTIQRIFTIYNATNQTVTMTQGSGGDVDVAAGSVARVYCDGAGSGAEVVLLTDKLEGIVSTSDIGSTVQAYDADLTAIAALAKTNGNFIVGDGSAWVAESGDTAIASLGVTATGAELNLLDGVTWTLTDYNTLTSTAAELNILDGATVTVAELNILDGDTAATPTTLADADRLVTNDNGTMVQVAMTDVSTYMFSSLSIDEDDMASDSATKLPTQQSTKAYVDSKAGMVHIVTKTASASATLDFTEFDASIYSQYVFTIHSLKPTSDGQDIRVVLSTDGGSTFVTTNDYDWGIAGNTVNAGTFDERDTSTSYIRIARDVDSDATRMGLCATLNLYDPSLAGDTVLGGTGMWHRNDNSRYNAVMHGFLNGSSAVDAIRFFAESGTLASGTITMYGLLK